MSHVGKMLIWCDPLYPCGVSDTQKEIMLSAAEQAIQTLERAEQTVETRYALSLFRALQSKIRILLTLRKNYHDHDLEGVDQICKVLFGRTITAYQDLMKAHRMLWEKSNRRQGWEVLSLRYGGAVGRLLDAQDEAERFLRQEIPVIPELEEKELPDGKGFLYSQVSVPSANCW